MELTINNKKESALGGILLIAGCCIGAGMLGLPVVSAMAGYIPSTLAMLLCCFFMGCTGLLILEASLYFDREVNLISIAGFVFGKAGKIGTGILFLAVFFCLMVAYTAAGGELFAHLLDIPAAAGVVAFIAPIGILLYLGARAVDHINRVLMAGLAASYIALIVLGTGNVDLSKLTYYNIGAALGTIPIMLVSFGYGNLVPGLTHYLNRNVKQLRLSIIIGSMIPLCIYLAWNTVILGLISNADAISSEIAANKIEMVTGLLKSASGSSSVLLLANAFSIFAIITSFLTNGLSCIDFIKDGLNLSGTSKQRLLLTSVILLPPTLFALVSPHLFLQALGYAGGFATVLLFGILPVAAVYKGRYITKVNAPYRAFGGKTLLAVIFFVSLTFLGFELAQQLHLL